MAVASSVQVAGCLRLDSIMRWSVIIELKKGDEKCMDGQGEKYMMRPKENSKEQKRRGESLTHSPSCHVVQLLILTTIISVRTGMIVILMT